jgi:hypothetical protein
MWRLRTHRKRRGNRAWSPTNFTGLDKTEEAHFIGILREKRENFLRITLESVLNLGRKVIGDHVDGTHIYFIQIEV